MSLAGRPGVPGETDIMLQYARPRGVSLSSMEPKRTSKAAERDKERCYTMDMLILPSPIASKVARDSQFGIFNTADCSTELLIMSIHLLLICGIASLSVKRIL